MKFRLAALLFCASATGCKPGPTTLALSIDAASGVTVQSLTLHLDLGGDDAGVSEALPPSGATPVLPGRAVVRLPDVAMDVAVALDGLDADGNPLHADTVVRTVPHHEVSASLTLGGVVLGDDLGMNGPDDLAVPVDAGLPCVAGERCNYLYRRQLTIHNGAAAALPAGYTVRVPLDATLFPSTKVRADLADVRVFRDAPAGELPRVIDTAPPGQGRALWLALAQPIAAGANDSTYSIYYGDAAATSPPDNATLVFPFYDGFDSGTAPSAMLWTTTSGGPTVGSGVLLLHQNTQDGVLTNKDTDNIPVFSVIEWRSKMTAPASAGQVTANGTFWWWVGFQDNFTPADPWIIWIQRGNSPVDVHGERKISSSSVCMNGCSTTATVVDANFHVYRIERDVNETRWYYDGAQSGGSPVADPNNTDHPLIIRNWAVTSDLQVDWIRARALAAPEPTVTVGAETNP